MELVAAGAYGFFGGAGTSGVGDPLPLLTSVEALKLGGGAYLECNCAVSALGDTAVGTVGTVVLELLLLPFGGGPETAELRLGGAKLLAGSAGLKEGDTTAAGAALRVEVFCLKASGKSFHPSVSCLYDGFGGPETAGGGADTGSGATGAGGL